MSKLISLGTASETTKANFYAGMQRDGVKAQNPSTGQWVHMKVTSGTIVDPATPG